MVGDEALAAFALQPEVTNLDLPDRALPHSGDGETTFQSENLPEGWKGKGRTMSSSSSMGGIIRRSGSGQPQSLPKSAACFHSRLRPLCAEVRSRNSQHSEYMTQIGIALLMRSSLSPSHSVNFRLSSFSQALGTPCTSIAGYLLNTARPEYCERDIYIYIPSTTYLK